MLRKALSLISSVALLVMAPALPHAQQASGIAGAVRDTSGAVLPGVTVEAASPALIEKVRSAVTDGEGRYNIVDLRPGTYTVTFTLPGFTGFRREGIVLTAGFTATVNADMQVGAVEETITVTGETPLVDTQNVRRQTVVSDEMLDMLPTSTKQANSLVALTLGLSGIADVAGIYSTQVGGGTFHGKGGARTQFDGMSVQNMTGNTGYMLNAALVQEMTLQSTRDLGGRERRGRAHQHDPERRRQHLRGHRVRALHERRPWRQQPERRAAQARARHGQHAAEDLRRDGQRSAGRSSGTSCGSSRRTASGATPT